MPKYPVVALMIRHGTMIVDHETGEPAGNLEPLVRSGLLNTEKWLPLSESRSFVLDAVCLELAPMGQNIALMLRALGLGGFYYLDLDVLLSREELRGGQRVENWSDN